MAWDAVWEDIFKSKAWGKYPAEELVIFVARNFYKASPRGAVKILEVGCGPGGNLWFMAREGFTVYGVDGSETAIRQTKQRLDNECPGWKGELVVGDIQRLPFKDGFFDAVIDNNAVCCNSYETSKAIYSETARVVKKDGKLFSRMMATGCWGDGTGQNVGHRAWIVSEGPLTGTGYVRFTDLSEVSDLVRGFNILNVESLVVTSGNRENTFKEWIIFGERA